LIDQQNKNIITLQEKNKFVKNILLIKITIKKCARAKNNRIAFDKSIEQERDDRKPLEI